MESRVLPVGIHSFFKISSRRCLYVDKTEFIYELSSEAGIYFLSRPRRFGKSLLISTLEAYLSGHKELFNGLKIHKLEEENPTCDCGAWMPSPIIKMDFNAGMYDSIDGLKKAISYKLLEHEKKYGIGKNLYLRVHLQGRGISHFYTRRSVHPQRGARYKRQNGCGM